MRALYWKYELDMMNLEDTARLKVCNNCTITARAQLTTKQHGATVYVPFSLVRSTWLTVSAIILKPMHMDMIWEKICAVSTSMML